VADYLLLAYIKRMKLTLQIQLLPREEQVGPLRLVMESFNAAATYAAQVGFAAEAFSQVAIHRLCYRELRTRFKLSAQLAVRAIGKAVEAFSRDKTKQPVFRAEGAISYDQRCFSLKGLTACSLLVKEGRIVVPMVYGTYQRERMAYLKGQVDLVARDGRWYLYATMEMPEHEIQSAKEFLGVDMGVINIATTSEGVMYSGTGVESIRVRRTTRRRRLQREASRQRKRGKRPRSVRRAQQRMGRKEARFRAYENHCISKKIVKRAEDTKRGFAIENLKHIRARIRFAKPQRARMSGWSFAQLRDYLAYKAKLAGVPVVVVSSAYTSQTCSTCGCRKKANRPVQERFACTACHYTAHADVNAAQNIAARGVLRNAPTGVVARAQPTAP